MAGKDNLKPVRTKEEARPSWDQSDTVGDSSCPLGRTPLRAMCATVVGWDVSRVRVRYFYD